MLYSILRVRAPALRMKSSKKQTDTQSYFLFLRTYRFARHLANRLSGQRATIIEITFQAGYLPDLTAITYPRDRSVSLEKSYRTIERPMSRYATSRIPTSHTMATHSPDIPGGRTNTAPYPATRPAGSGNHDSRISASDPLIAKNTQPTASPNLCRRTV